MFQVLFHSRIDFKSQPLRKDDNSLFIFVFRVLFIFHTNTPRFVIRMVYLEEAISFLQICRPIQFQCIFNLCGVSFSFVEELEYYRISFGLRQDFHSIIPRFDVIWEKGGIVFSKGR